jgi:hypothetical protein
MYIIIRTPQKLFITIYLVTKYTNVYKYVESVLHEPYTSLKRSKIKSKKSHHSSTTTTTTIIIILINNV